MSTNRRRFLRGAAGSLLALPVLESLLPRRPAFADGPTPPKRALWWFTPNGHNMSDWTPAETGGDYTLSPILQPFAPYRDKMTVISGLRNYGASDPEGEDQGHGGVGAWLHCRDAYEDGARSVDQYLADAIGEGTPFRSLELGLDAADGSNKGSISWAGPGEPLPKVITAAALFARLFGSGASLSPAEVARRRDLRLSVLDGVMGDFSQLNAELPVRDRLKLEQYTTAIRELELRIDQSASSTCDPGDPPDPEGDPIDQMGAVMALAFQCDLTRVMTFMLGKEGNNSSHTHLGIPEAYHGLSHHNYDPALLAKLTTIQTWQCQTFADGVLRRLNEAEDVDGSTLLDNTTILYGSGVSDSHYHDNHDLPSVLFGSSDTFAHGHHLQATDEPLADLHLAMCASVGAEFESLGAAGTGPLEGLA
jgi:hypothetical protein